MSFLLLPLQSLTGRRQLSCVCTPLSSCGTAHLPLTRILTDLLLFAWSSRVRCHFGSSGKRLSSLPPSRGRLRLSTTGSFASLVFLLGSCGYTVPRSAWLLRCSPAGFCESPLQTFRSLRPTFCVAFAVLEFVVAVA